MSCACVMMGAESSVSNGRRETESRTKNCRSSSMGNSWRSIGGDSSSLSMNFVWIQKVVVDVFSNRVIGLAVVCGTRDMATFGSLCGEGVTEGVLVDVLVVWGIVGESGIAGCARSIYARVDVESSPKKEVVVAGPWVTLVVELGKEDFGKALHSGVSDRGWGMVKIEETEAYGVSSGVVSSMVESVESVVEVGGVLWSLGLWR